MTPLQTPLSLAPMDENKFPHICVYFIKKIMQMFVF